MTNPQVQNDPIVTLPVLNINGFLVTLDATTPNTKLNLAAGTARDSNNIMDITLGAANPNLQGVTEAAPLVLDTAVVGANGLDAGTLAASKVYAVYAIADSRGYKAVAGLVSLASNSSPTMPQGYDSYRLVGYAVTDASVHFLPAYISGTGNARLFTYDAPQATAVTAGSSATYAGVVLTALVPPVNNVPVVVQTNWTANAAADTLKMQGFASTGDAVSLIAPVAGATAHTITYSTVLAQLNSAAPTINYKVSAAAVAINVAGFWFFV
jgi:hypothetical protein